MLVLVVSRWHLKRAIASLRFILWPLIMLTFALVRATLGDALGLCLPSCGSTSGLEDLMRDERLEERNGTSKVGSYSSCSLGASLLYTMYNVATRTVMKQPKNKKE
jgi:hypothetical protein